jgi:hypothetical protein
MSCAAGRVRVRDRGGGTEEGGYRADNGVVHVCEYFARRSEETAQRVQEGGSGCVDKQLGHVTKEALQAHQDRAEGLEKHRRHRIPEYMELLQEVDRME